jgi:hypothetical protein
MTGARECFRFRNPMGENESMSYDATIKCPHCGALNSRSSLTCISCSAHLQSADSAASIIELPPSAPAAQRKALPLPRVPNPITVDDFMGWHWLLLIIPPLGLLFSIIWICQRRPGAWGCLAAVLIYMLAMYILRFYYWWPMVEFGPLP